MPSIASPVLQYLNSVPQRRHKKILSLHQLILSLYPDVMVDMKYKMPTYSTDRGWVALANQKNYISLYTCSAEHLLDFKDKHPGIKTGKGCINFKDRDELPLDELTQVIKSAMEKQN